MPDHKTVLESAYEYARSGRCRDLADIKHQLKRAGFTMWQVEDHLEGKLLRQQLSRLCHLSQAEQH